MKKVGISLIAMLSIPFPVYAASNRLDVKMLAAILYFLRCASYPVFIIALAMFIISVKSTDGGMKVNSLKLFGIGLALFSLYSVAKASGIIN